MFKKQKTENNVLNASAKVVDGTLILSLPNAVSPIVWRWDLGDAKASAIEVRENDGQYQLILKAPRGDVHTIAPFAQKEDALDALLKVSHAMESAHGQIKPQTQAVTSNNVIPNAQPAAVSPIITNPNAAEDTNLAGTILIGVGGLMVLGILLLWLGSVQPRTLEGNTPSDVSTPAQSKNTDTKDDTDTGVPLSADDFLNGL